MFRAFFTLIAAAFLSQALVSPALAQGNCAFCDTDPKERKCKDKPGKKPKKGCELVDGPGDGTDDPIALSIETDLDFGRLIMIGDGQGKVIIDVDSGAKIVTGGLDDLGGIAMNGTAVITGLPSRAVSISFPALVTLRDPAGGAAELREFKTNLPMQAILDSNGRLEFSFTGTLYTGDSIAIGGNLRGRVPIRVEYD